MKARRVPQERVAAEGAVELGGGSPTDVGCDGTRGYGSGRCQVRGSILEGLEGGGGCGSAPSPRTHGEIEGVEGVRGETCGRVDVLAHPGGHKGRDVEGDVHNGSVLAGSGELVERDDPVGDQRGREIDLDTSGCGI